ncbi:lysine decarboxylase [Lysinibacillus sp. 2017]|uniref:aminotransferase class I/II-fold pyridoxal phosphate-dependent enzyme n=1 Tax=unclassified Lysinibacillus TaxID=2636778 RepID=UPI000D525B0B|nr:MULTISPECIES: aminotransferase class I/II-fold pyridoxal phosphate-dependent enzyme [unclassified Lysinibacillus]AWE05928.1 lysine decarboxylase [Lysinibacillus sp. 2017]TGN33423.1 aminotransferase class I/II-fold pyridoxal phosphate-dependent enzyme [Lysinibacillus sp. S2017]
MKNDRPIVQALKKFIANEPQSLHVPGHKNGLLSNLPNEIKRALIYDVTELTGLDDFHHPEEAILQAEQLLAEVYEANRSFFLVNGSTVGNLAMVYATCKQGDTVLVQRNAHKSIFHALELVGVNPVYLAPKWHEESKTAGCVEKETLQEAIKRFPHVKAVIFTYPTYYGITVKDLEEQIELCHSLGIPVLVDEAHGAHLIASEQLPKSSLQLGADVVVQSAHKTLPAMTMASFLHMKSTLVSEEKVNHYLRMLQSSSPSYLLLASLDDARSYVENYTESDFVYLMGKRKQFIESLQTLTELQIIEVDDALKLLVRAPGYTGFELKDALEKMHVYVELADVQQVLLILPLLKHGENYSFADLRIRMKEAVIYLKNAPGILQDITANFEMTNISQPQLSFAEIEQAKKEWIPYMRAIGRVAASMIIPYPPGIPLFVPGEKITVAKLSQLEELLAIGATFQGEHRLQEKCIYVIK